MEDWTMKTRLSIKQAANRPRHRAILIAMLAFSSLFVFGGQTLGVSPQKAQAAEAAQQVPFPCSTTLAVTEGPYWRAGSPERTTLIDPGMVGVRVLVTG